MPSKYLKDENGEFIHRKYSVDGNLFYSGWVLIEEKTPEEGIQKFIESKDWAWYENYYEVKYKSHTVSKDGLNVSIKVREMNQKELRKARK